MGFTWINNVTAGETIIRNSSGSSIENEIKKNIQTIWTGLQLGTVTYSNSMEAGDKVETLDWSEIRQKVDTAVDNNRCKADNANFYSNDKAANYQTNNTSNNPSVYGAYCASYLASHYPSTYGSTACGSNN